MRLLRYQVNCNFCISHPETGEYFIFSSLSMDKPDKVIACFAYAITNSYYIKKVKFLKFSNMSHHYFPSLILFNFFFFFLIQRFI
jgi:hypothetical protein